MNDEPTYTTRIAAQFMSGGAYHNYNDDFKKKLMELWELEKQLPEEDRKFSIFLAFVSIHIVEEYKDMYGKMQKAIVSQNPFTSSFSSTSERGEELGETAVRFMKGEM